MQFGHRPVLMPTPCSQTAGPGYVTKRSHTYHQSITTITPTHQKPLPQLLLVAGEEPCNRLKMRESSKSDAVLSRDEDEFIDYGAAGTPEPEPSPDQWSHVWASLNGASQSSNLFDEVAGSHLSGRSCSSTWNPADQSASTGRTYGGLGDKSDTSFDVPTTPDSSPASINDPIQDHVGLQIRASSSCSHELSQPLCINPKVLHSPPSLTTDESSKMDPIESSQTLRRAVQPRALAPARPKKMTLSVLKPMRVTKRTVKPKSTRQCDIK